MIVLRKISQGLFGLTITDEHGDGKEVPLVEFAWLDEPSQLAILQPTVDYYNGRRYKTQYSAFSKFRNLFKVLKSLGLSSLPKDEEGWQTFLLNAFRAWMSRKSSASVKNSVTDWNTIHRFIFKLLQDATDLIPIGVLIPEGSRRIANETHSSLTPFIGQNKPEKTFRTDQLIITIDLERSDAEYLDELRDRLTHQCSVLEQSCIAWWRQIEEHFRYGQTLISDTDKSALQARVASGKFREYRDGGQIAMGQYHFANGDNECALANLLSLLAEHHQSRFTKDLLGEVEYLPHLCSINITEKAPRTISPLVSTIERLNWMLGNLSPTDCAIATILLTIQCPRFTPTAIAEAKVTDKNGKKYFESGDGGFVFHVDKHRANAIKGEHLSAETAALITLISEMTSHHRENLGTEKSRLANSFFITTVAGEPRKFAYVSAISLINGSKHGDLQGVRWLGSYFPELVGAGITKGSLTLRRIRATQGVLEWFKTHSIQAVARKLGNSTQVSIEHYLPKALLATWYTRLIRRFQNLWIAVASANETYQLAVTDFGDLQALHKFLLDMLDLMPSGSSPLADELHRRVFKADQDGNTAHANNASLSIPASSEVFLALHMYKEAAMNSGIAPDLLRKIDPETGISPNDLMALSDLVRIRAADDRNSQIRKAHEEALEALPQMSRDTNWVDLFAQWRDQHA